MDFAIYARGLMYNERLTMSSQNLTVSAWSGHSISSCASLNRGYRKHPHGSAGGWQYLRRQGGAILESGIHNADMQIYLAGSVKTVTGQVRLTEPERVFKGMPVTGFHDHYAHNYPDVQMADAPDIAMANLEFENSALGQWLDDKAAYGPGFRRFTIFVVRGKSICQACVQVNPFSYTITSIMEF